MKVKLLFAALTAVVALAMLVTAVSAHHPGPVTGVVVDIEFSPGDLTGFTISDAQGDLIEVFVGPETEFGLEDSSGERWVATPGNDPDVNNEARARLFDHRQRFAPVTAMLDESDVAITVVEAADSNLPTNLWYLFAAFALSWAGFFIYAFWVSRKQRSLQLELQQTQQLAAAPEDGARQDQ